MNAKTNLFFNSKFIIAHKNLLLAFIISYQGKINLFLVLH